MPVMSVRVTSESSATRIVLVTGMLENSMVLQDCREVACRRPLGSAFYGAEQDVLGVFNLVRVSQVRRLMGDPSYERRDGYADLCFGHRIIP